MTELRGSRIVEKRGYQGVASMTSPKWRKHITVKGIQHIKSVRIMAVIFASILKDLFWELSILLAEILVLMNMMA